MISFRVPRHAVRRVRNRQQLCGRFFGLGLLRASDPVAATFYFFHFVFLYKFVEDARQEAASAMPQSDSVGNFTDARGLRDGREVGDDFARRNIPNCIFIWRLGGLTWRDWHGSQSG